MANVFIEKKTNWLLFVFVVKATTVGFCSLYFFVLNLLYFV